jgi:hypothetical protein
LRLRGIGIEGEIVRVLGIVDLDGAVVALGGDLFAAVRAPVVVVVEPVQQAGKTGCANAD